MTNLPLPQRARTRDVPPASDEQTRPGRAPSATDARPARAIRCAACGHAVAHERDRTSRDGAHEHAFANPRGIPYRIALFAAAPGCVPIGDPTAEATWFPPFEWRIALCGACGDHLGWRYDHRDAGFFGLIVTRIVDPER
jgi:hypothetical protein